MKKETLAQVFSCKCCKTLQSFFKKPIVQQDTYLDLDHYDRTLCENS